jgi:hypothetical protein
MRMICNTKCMHNTGVLRHTLEERRRLYHAHGLHHCFDFTPFWKENDRDYLSSILTLISVHVLALTLETIVCLSSNETSSEGWTRTRGANCKSYYCSYTSSRSPSIPKLSQNNGSCCWLRRVGACACPAGVQGGIAGHDDVRGQGPQRWNKCALCRRCNC